MRVLLEQNVMKISSVKYTNSGYVVHNKSTKNNENQPITFTGQKFLGISKQSLKKKGVGLMPYIAGAAFVVMSFLNAFVAEKRIDSNLNNKKKDILPESNLCESEEITRKQYKKALDLYPNLSNKYTQMLEEAASNPDDKENKANLESYEKILKIISKPESQQYYKTYFKALNSDYINDFDNILTNFRTNETNRGSANKFLALINNGRISSEELSDWTKYPHLNCDEYKEISSLSGDKKQQLDKMKEQGKVSGFEIIEYNKFPVFAFHLDFPEGIRLEDKMKYISEVFQILHGEINSTDNELTDRELSTKYNIRNRIFKRISLDKALESVYNVARYLNYDYLKYFDYTSSDILNNYQKGSDTTSLRTIIHQAIQNTDIKSQKMQDFVDIMNDVNMFSDCFGGKHAVFRFVTRIVLNNKPNADLKTETPKQLETFKELLNKRFSDRCVVFNYRYGDLNLPSFYVPVSGTEGRMKVSLNKEGKILTLYDEVSSSKKDLCEEDADLCVQT